MLGKDRLLKEGEYGMAGSALAFFDYSQCIAQAPRLDYRGLRVPSRTWECCESEVFRGKMIYLGTQEYHTYVILDDCSLGQPSRTVIGVPIDQQITTT